MHTFKFSKNHRIECENFWKNFVMKDRIPIILRKHLSQRLINLIVFGNLCSKGSISHNPLNTFEWPGLEWTEVVDTRGEKHVWTRRGEVDYSAGLGVFYIFNNICENIALRAKKKFYIDNTSEFPQKKCEEIMYS